MSSTLSRRPLKTARGAKLLRFSSDFGHSSEREREREKRPKGEDGGEEGEEGQEGGEGGSVEKERVGEKGSFTRKKSSPPFSSFLDETRIKSGGNFGSVEFFSFPLFRPSLSIFLKLGGADAHLKRRIYRRNRQEMTPTP